MDSPFTPELHSAWKDLEAQLEPARPSVGKLVKVTSGRHAGTVGQVFWHGIDKWNTCPPQNSAQAESRALRGTYGYRVGIQAGSDKFFVSALDVEVVSQPAEKES